MQTASTLSETDSQSPELYSQITDTHDQTPIDEISKPPILAPIPLEVIQETIDIPLKSQSHPISPPTLSPVPIPPLITKDDLQFICSLHNSEIMFFCNHDDCFNRYVCLECIKRDMKHFNDHKPMISIDDVLQYLNDNSERLEVQNQHIVSQLLDTLLEEIRQCVQHNMEQRARFDENLINTINSCNRRERKSLESMYSNMSSKGNDQSLIELQPQKSNTKEDVDEFIQRVAKKNKEKELIDRYLSDVKLEYAFVKFREGELGDKYSSLFREVVEAGISSKEGDQFANEVPHFTLKINTFQNLGSLDLHHDVNFNTHIYMDLNNFKEKERRLTLQTLRIYSIPYLSMKFSKKIDLFSLYLNNEVKNLNLNFSACREKLERADLDMITDPSLPFNKIEPVSLNELVLNLCLNSIDGNSIDFVTNILSKVKEVNSLVLDLHLNILNLPQIEQIAKSLQQYSTLRSLSISLNGFGYIKTTLGADSKNMLFTTISQLDRIEKLVLNLSNTSLDSAGVRNIQCMISTLPKLRYVDIDISSNEDIADITVRDLVKGLEKCMNLVSFKLNIDSLPVEKESALSIVQSVAEFGFLKEVLISAEHSNQVFRSISLFQDEKSPKETRISPPVNFKSKTSNSLAIESQPQLNFLNPLSASSRLEPESQSNSPRRQDHSHVDQQNKPDKLFYSIQPIEQKKEEESKS